MRSSSIRSRAPKRGASPEKGSALPQQLPNQPTEPVEPGSALFIAAQDILKFFQLGRLVVDGTALGRQDGDSVFIWDVFLSRGIQRIAVIGHRAELFT